MWVVKSSSPSSKATFYRKSDLFQEVKRDALEACMLGSPLPNARMSVLVGANSVLGGRNGNKPKKVGLKTQPWFFGVQDHPPSLLSHRLAYY